MKKCSSDALLVAFSLTAAVALFAAWALGWLTPSIEGIFTRCC